MLSIFFLLLPATFVPQPPRDLPRQEMFAVLPAECEVKRIKALEKLKSKKVRAKHRRRHLLSLQKRTAKSAAYKRRGTRNK